VTVRRSVASLDGRFYVVFGPPPCSACSSAVADLRAAGVRAEKVDTSPIQAPDAFARRLGGWRGAGALAALALLHFQGGSFPVCVSDDGQEVVPWPAFPSCAPSSTPAPAFG
jgi:hypothetical protein